MGKILQGESGRGPEVSDSDSATSDTLLNLLSVPFNDLAALPDEQAAEVLGDRMKAWDAIDDLRERSFADRGRIALAFQERMLWRHLGYSSFESWMASGRGGSRTTKYAALAAVKELKDVPAEKLAEIPRCNVSTLVGCSTATRNDPEVLEAAKGSEESFTAYLAEKHPLQHIEAKKRLRMMLGLSIHEHVELAIAMTMEDGLAGTREDALGKVAEMAIENLTTERMVNSKEFREAIDAPPLRVM